MFSVPDNKRMLLNLWLASTALRKQAIIGNHHLGINPESFIRAPARQPSRPGDSGKGVYVQTALGWKDMPKK